MEMKFHLNIHEWIITFKREIAGINSENKINKQSDEYE